MLRGQVFAGDALGHVAYTGALAALAAGVDLRLGLFAATVTVGLGLGVLGGRGAADDVVIGTIFAWVLGLGVFFLASTPPTPATTQRHRQRHRPVRVASSASPPAPRPPPLASPLGLTALLLLIARPLLFATLDPAVAAAAGVPVRLLGPLFLALVGATAAEATQVIGALLLFGLLAAPPAAAQRLTDRPWRGLSLSAGLAVTSVWTGVTIAYAAPGIPRQLRDHRRGHARDAGALLTHRLRARPLSPAASTSTVAAQAGPPSGPLPASPPRTAGDTQQARPGPIRHRQTPTATPLSWPPSPARAGSAPPSN